MKAWHILVANAVILCGFINAASAFPEMTVHGYVNCTACHISPSGGGVLTEYGRGLSRDLLSLQQGLQPETEASEEAIPKWFLPGGDVRIIQTYLDTPTLRRGDFFLMQTEFMAAIRWMKWTVVASLGIKGGPNSVEDRNDLHSRVHYLMYQVAETTSVRAGRFLPQYGLQEPNHTIVTRQGLGFGESSETDNLEIASAGERWDLFATAIGGRPEDTNKEAEKGFALSTSYNFLDKNKLAFNIYQGKNSRGGRWLAGLWGIFSLSEKFFLLSEIDHQWSNAIASRTTSAEKRGIASYQRLGYQVAQGLQIYAVHQLSYLDFDSVLSRQDAFGPGIDLFPMEHLEIRAEFLKQRMMSRSPDYFDAAWLLAHYYF
jgi:hypothetical protein